MWQKLSRCYPPRLEIFPLVVLALTWYVAVSAYPTLPPVIPTHFGITGAPDGWGSKTGILLYPGLSMGLYALFTVINIGLAVARDPRSWINLPSKLKSNLTDARAEELRIFMNRCLFAMKSLMLVLNFYGVHINVQVAQGRAGSLGAPWFLLLAAVIGLAGYMTWRSISIVGSSRRAGS